MKNWHSIVGHYKQILGKFQQYWGYLSRNKAAVIKGRRLELLGRIEELHASHEYP